MARIARFKVNDDEAWYHIYSQVSGAKGEYLLSIQPSQQKLIDLIKHFSSIYFCNVSAFCVMGNHYHIVVKFEKPKTVSQFELKKRLSMLYPHSEKFLKNWTDEDWKHFKERLFNVSEYMRSIQSTFARWYNKIFERRGRFWSDRFKSVYLEDLHIVLDCMLYIELNPVRAGLIERPEEWNWSSFYLREKGLDDWLLPLNDVVGEKGDETHTEYKMRLYYRGAVSTKEGQLTISSEIIRDEEKRGFKEKGIYRKRLRYFVDGIALGSKDFIREQIEQMRNVGHYIRRKNPIEHLDGMHQTVREQRSHAKEF